MEIELGPYEGIVVHAASVERESPDAMRMTRAEDGGPTPFFLLGSEDVG